MRPGLAARQTPSGSGRGSLLGEEALESVAMAFCTPDSPIAAAEAAAADALESLHQPLVENSAIASL